MEYLIAIFLMLLFALAMAVGIILTRKVLRRGCTLDPTGDPDESCGICGRKKADCPEK